MILVYKKLNLLSKYLGVPIYKHILKTIILWNTTIPINSLALVFISYFFISISECYNTAIIDCFMDMQLCLKKILDENYSKPTFKAYLTISLIVLKSSH